ncbi:MAG: hypothetical protein ACLPVW_06160 [Terriglobales bacterium]
MANIAPNRNPKTLAEKLAANGSTCPIPATHDRLAEVHHWWHEMAELYHEPDPFRYRLGAFATAARIVTLMLQAERAVFENFDFYEKVWVPKAKADPIMQWLNDTRTTGFHRSALAPSSWLEMECFRNPRKSPWDEDDGPIGTRDPFQCTHFYMNSGPTTDHGHNFTRHWSMEGLNGRELLEVCAHIYDRLDEIVTEAHERMGANIVSWARPESLRRLPCMEDIDRYRIVKTRVRRGKEVWINRPRRPHPDREAPSR